MLALLNLFFENEWEHVKDIGEPFFRNYIVIYEINTNFCLNNLPQYAFSLLKKYIDEDNCKQYCQNSLFKFCQFKLVIAQR